MEARYLAFDLGGSGGKLMLCLFDGEHIALEEVHRFDNEPVAARDCLYWDLWSLYRELNVGVRKAFERTGGIRSIGLDSFANDHAFIDARGELLTPLRCYRDKRTVRHAQDIYAAISAQRLYEITGNQVAPFNTLMQLASMRLAGQGHILDNAHKLLFTPDLLVNLMTGAEVAEYTISSVSQMFDFTRNDWSDEILDAFQIPRRLFAPIVASGTMVGRTSSSYNYELGIRGLDVVAVCEHDTASAFLSAPSEGERAVISSGTWSLVGTEVPSPIITEEGFRNNIANEGGLPGRHRLLRNVMGLWILQELRRERASHGERFDFSDMESAARAATPFAHRIDPDDPSFFSPSDMHAAIAAHCALHGGPAPETVGETVRCVVEGLAFKYRWAIEKIEALTGRRLPLVNIVGGGTKNRLLSQLTADACGRPVLAGPAEATALGNVLVQLMADGEISSIEQGRDLIRKSFPLEEYKPRNAALWSERYAEYKEAFQLA